MTTAAPDATPSVFVLVEYGKCSHCGFNICRDVGSDAGMWVEPGTWRHENTDTGRTCPDFKAGQ